MYRFIIAYDQLSKEEEEILVKVFAHYNPIEVTDNCFIIDTVDKIRLVKDKIKGIFKNARFVIAEVSSNMPSSADNFHMFVSPPNDDISGTLD